MYTYVTSKVYNISEEMLIEACVIKETQRCLQPMWQYKLEDKVPSLYCHQTAQSLLEIAYRVSIYNREVSKGDKDPIKLNPPGFDIIIPLNTSLLFDEVNVMWFFYSSSMNIIMIIPTATYNNKLVIIDLNYFHQEPNNISNYKPGTKIHRGFLNFYNSIQSKLHLLLQKYLNQDTQVIISGLSLGGAISTITAMDLYQRKIGSIVINNLVHYSFAGPRIFNIIGSTNYNNLNIFSYQIHNGSDIIPNAILPIMPSSFNFKSTQDFMHVDHIIYFDKHLGNYYDNHITAYINHYEIIAIT